MTEETYQQFAAFWIDDAAYEVGRGVRYLALPGYLDNPEEHKESIANSASFHGVSIRVLDGEVQVASDPWVFDLMDKCNDLPDGLRDALIGALLGYSSHKIAAFITSDGGDR